MSGADLADKALMHVGRIGLTAPLLYSLAITAMLGAVSAWIGRGLASRRGRMQIAAEAIVEAMSAAVGEVVAPPEVPRVLPFVATLWIFILTANLLGLVPGLESPTRDLSVTAALATCVFLAVHAYGIRAAGLKAYLRHYLSPNPVLLPFHLVSELTRTLALAVRLFGNMMSLEMAAMLVLLVAGFLVPVPLLLLHVIEAIVQAYIFGMLALIYIGSAQEAAADKSPPIDRSPTPPEPKP